VKKLIESLIGSVRKDLSRLKGILDWAPDPPDLTFGKIVAELGAVQLKLRRLHELHYGRGLNETEFLERAGPVRIVEKKKRPAPTPETKP
jgi:hypothetical protein